MCKKTKCLLRARNCGSRAIDEISHKHKSQTEDLKVYVIHIYYHVISTLASLNLLLLMILHFSVLSQSSISYVQ